MRTGVVVGVVAGLGVALAAVALRRREPAPPPAPAPGPCCGTPECGGVSRVSVRVPGGWRRMTSAEARPYVAMASAALRANYRAPYGTLVPIADGVAALIEQHCHEPGGAIEPWGYHTGVSLLTAV